MSEQTELAPIVKTILNSRKYRDLDIPCETVMQLLRLEIEKSGKLKSAIKNTKQKLHNIVAPYLGDPDYEEAVKQLNFVMETNNPEKEREFCRKMLNSHASTRERLPQLTDFYHSIFEITGKPASILDLACGLHPFSIPWMNLPELEKYCAYDLHQPRILLLQTYFDSKSWDGIALHQDILVEAPKEQAEVAFLFKETHRMESREKDCNVRLWDALQVDWLVVTLPAISLSHHHDLRKKHIAMVDDLLEKTHTLWNRIDIEVNQELIFCLQKIP